MTAFGCGLSWWFDAVDANGAATQVSDAGAFGAIPWIDLDRGYGAFLFIRDRLQTGVDLYNAILSLVQDPALRFPSRTVGRGSG